MTQLEEIFDARIDQKRIASLKPVESALMALRLPVIRIRKLNGILNALIMQIETGSDSAEVNSLLVQALRAAVLAQVGPQTGQPALEALERFEQTENNRLTAGSIQNQETSPNTKPQLVKINQLIKQGTKAFEKFDSLKICQPWLEAWQIVKQLASPDLPSLERFSHAYPTLTDEFPNWCQELMFELNNAGIDNSAYYQSCLTYIDEFWTTFPAELQDNEFVLSFERGRGEALWNLGQIDTSEAAFASLVEKLPNEGWAYIGWSDQYWLGNFSAKDFEHGEAILLRALQYRFLKDRKDVLERLLMLYQETDNPAAEKEIQRQLDAINPVQPPAIFISPPAIPASQPAAKTRPRHKKKNK